MRWLKLSCLLIYALALAGWSGIWQGAAANAIQIVALVILALHGIEAVIGFRYVRLYRGGLAMSVLLTLLFGMLHLLPLARQARRSQPARWSH